MKLRALYVTMTLCCYAMIVSLPSSSSGQTCAELERCTETSSAAFNNMHAGSFGQYFEAPDEGLCVCGFRVKVSGLNCSPEIPCRAVLYSGILIKSGETADATQFNELAAVEITEDLEGEVEFMFPPGGYAGYWNSEVILVIETQDSEWLLWQDCNASEDCCPNSWPVSTSGAVMNVNFNSNDDYYFLVLGNSDIAGCAGVVGDEKASWGSAKAIYR